MAKLGIPLSFPYSEKCVALFVTHLINKRLKSSTIRSYLSALSSVHKIFSAPDPTNSYLISRILKGNENLYKQSSKLSPISKQILHKLLNVIPSLFTPYESKFYKSLFLLAYYCCLRSCEVTKSEKVTHTLQLEDVSIQNNPHPLLINIKFRSFKHSQEQTTITLHPRVNSPYCPILNLLDYIAARGDEPGPLFMLHSNLSFKRSQYSKALKLCLSSIDLPQAKYNTHSFRIGRATDLALEGTPPQIIKTTGRWRSNAYEKYIRISQLSFSNI